MQPLEYCDDKPLPPKDEILDRLAGRAGREALLEVLRLLCPCRNTYRDRDVWRAVLHLWTKPHHVPEVRGGAHHAVESLRERARVDTQTYALLRDIGVGPGQRRHRWRWDAAAARHPRVVRNDVPTIIEMLASDDPIEHADALAALFPTRGYHIARSVWLEIERFARVGEGRVRAKAGIALARIAQHRSAAA